MLKNIRLSFQKAVNNGLFALVADGVHKLNPRSKRHAPVRMEEGQLYTIHGVCRGGFEAAINAAIAVFPLSSVEGCGWHLTQAWVRNRNRLGLRRFVQGDRRDPRVIHWWRTLKGLPFLPRDHFHLVSALTVVPVEPTHPAYEPCQNFLDYFNRTWLNGPSESMWCKYLVKELRTTNLAENFHGRLRGLFSGRKHPKFNALITMLQEITGVAASRLNRMAEFPEEMRPLRARDRARREKTEGAMAAFARIQGLRYVTTAVVGRYCRKMSRYTSDRAI
ncbi:hypothetical protein ANCCAN_21772 [Ancylostoma caninum]|uniref:MULE transposase domain-containing protein n=1 Tax=Ancylostoma caninum TaxID=29170 RepID=A0A368FLL0_ANCCA|nr:hypothetical protein ANCCAN_21772 [Ancylostoma caninum]